MEFFIYFMEEYKQILELLLEHINLTLLSVLLAVMIGIPIGILISHFKRANKTVLAIANTIQAIPSMALLGFLIPLLGIGVFPSIVMVILYSLLPIIKNTYTSIEGINPQVIEAAEGIGLTKMQILFKIQIPMALPVIMTGVRISAVTAVGLMTIAAFVGAGGLGYLVFSGIRTANSYQILAGAIPACILALFIDWIASIIERAVVPTGISMGETEGKKKVTLFQKIVLILTIIGILFGLTEEMLDKVIGKKEDRIVVASKDFTEQIILGNIVSEMIENNTNIKVDRKFALGGTQIIFGAMNKGEVDLYLDYSGTIISEILNHSVIQEKIKSEDVYSIVKDEMERKFKVVIGNELDFNNSFRLAVKKDLAKEYNLKTISDLEKISSQLVLSPTFDFTNRDDGLIGLVKAYDKLKFKNVVSIDGALRYQAIDIGDSQVIDAYATDGLIDNYDLFLLEDNKKFFPPYHAVPIIREEVVEKYPEIEKLIEQLKPLLDDKTMRELNAKVDREKIEPREVAHQFLVENNLITK